MSARGVIGSGAAARMMRFLPQIGERETEPRKRNIGGSLSRTGLADVVIMSFWPVGVVSRFTMIMYLGSSVTCTLPVFALLLTTSNMVLGLISLAATVPMVATSVLNLQSQAENTKSHGIEADWKSEKCRIKCRLSARTPEDRKELFKGSEVVLRDGRLYVQLPIYQGQRLHSFSGYYLPYPDSNFEGLVSTISDEPPQLNWIYLDTGSRIFQICHGLRTAAEEGLTGPWGARVCSDGEIRFLMENWEGFIAVESEEPGLWSLCFDRFDDGLQGKLKEGQRTVELELIREALDN